MAGRVTFELEDGCSPNMNAGGPQLRYIDRAWASIVHACQGRTVDKVIAAIEADHPSLTNQKMLYVEVSRAHDRAEIVTDDRAALREQFEAIGERIAALEAVGRSGRMDGKRRQTTGRIPGTVWSPATRSVDTDVQKTHAPKTPERELGL